MIHDFSDLDRDVRVRWRGTFDQLLKARDLSQKAVARQMSERTDIVEATLTSELSKLKNGEERTLRRWFNKDRPKRVNILAEVLGVKVSVLDAALQQSLSPTSGAHIEDPWHPCFGHVTRDQGLVWIEGSRAFQRADEWIRSVAARWAEIEDPNSDEETVRRARRWVATPMLISGPPGSGRRSLAALAAKRFAELCEGLSGATTVLHDRTVVAPPPRFPKGPSLQVAVVDAEPAAVSPLDEPDYEILSEDEVLSIVFSDPPNFIALSPWTWRELKSVVGEVAGRGAGVDSSRLKGAESASLYLDVQHLAYADCALTLASALMEHRPTGTRELRETLLASYGRRLRRADPRLTVGAFAAAIAGSSESRVTSPWLVLAESHQAELIQAIVSRELSIPAAQINELLAKISAGERRFVQQLMSRSAAEGGAGDLMDRLSSSMLVREGPWGAYPSATGLTVVALVRAVVDGEVELPRAGPLSGSLRRGLLTELCKQGWVGAQWEAWWRSTPDEYLLTTAWTLLEYLLQAPTQALAESDAASSSVLPALWATCALDQLRSDRKPRSGVSFSRGWALAGTGHGNRSARSELLAGFSERYRDWLPTIAPEQATQELAALAGVRASRVVQALDLSGCRPPGDSPSWGPRFSAGPAELSRFFARESVPATHVVKRLPHQCLALEMDEVIFCAAPPRARLLWLRDGGSMGEARGVERLRRAFADAIPTQTPEDDELADAQGDVVRQVDPEAVELARQALAHASAESRHSLLLHEIRDAAVSVDELGSVAAKAWMELVDEDKDGPVLAALAAAASLTSECDHDAPVLEGGLFWCAVEAGVRLCLDGHCAPLQALYETRPDGSTLEDLTATPAASKPWLWAARGLVRVGAPTIARDVLTAVSELPGDLVTPVCDEVASDSVVGFTLNHGAFLARLPELAGTSKALPLARLGLNLAEAPLPREVPGGALGRVWFTTFSHHGGRSRCQNWLPSVVRRLGPADRALGLAAITDSDVLKGVVEQELEHLTEPLARVVLGALYDRVATTNSLSQRLLIDALKQVERSDAGTAQLESEPWRYDRREGITEHLVDGPSGSLILKLLPRYIDEDPDAFARVTRSLLTLWDAGVGHFDDWLPDPREHLWQEALLALGDADLLDSAVERLLRRHPAAWTAPMQRYYFSTLRTPELESVATKAGTAQSDPALLHLAAMGSHVAAESAAKSVANIVRTSAGHFDWYDDIEYESGANLVDAAALSADSLAAELDTVTSTEEKMLHAAQFIGLTLGRFPGLEPLHCRLALRAARANGLTSLSDDQSDEARDLHAGDDKP